MLTNDDDSPNVHDMERWREQRDAQAGARSVINEVFATTELPAYTRAMNDINREELSARLETIEIKMDARVQSVSSKIDGFLAAQAERDKRLDAALAQISKDHSETKSGISSMKTTLIVTAISTALAIILGIAGFNTALTSNMMSAFQLGRSDQPAPQAVTPSNAAPTAPAATPSPSQR